MVNFLQVGNQEGALEELRRAMRLSEELQDFSLDADIWGEMADTYADLGKFELAAEVHSLLLLWDDLGGKFPHVD